MVKVKGRMAVNVINGRNGQFSIATLYSDIGDFVVHYDGLDQYDPGTYVGVFVIRDTTLRIRQFGVGKIIEPIAYLEDLVLEVADESQRDAVPDAIPDPIEDDSPGKPASVSTAPSVDEDSLKELFGKIWPLGEEVKLDPTVGRSVLRSQTTYLKSVGYKYMAKEQIWVRRH